MHADDGILTIGYPEGVKLYDELRPDVVLFLRRVSNPSRYGIAIARDEGGSFDGFRLVRILDVEEKPSNPRSDIAISAVYIFNRKIIEGLRAVKAGNELELTYGIKNVINGGGEAYGLLLGNDSWLNVGSVEDYFNSMVRTFKS